jgi:hypothetical protein
MRKEDGREEKPTKRLVDISTRKYFSTNASDGKVSETHG